MKNLYNSITDLPVWNFDKINQTGDFGYLCKEYKKCKLTKELIETWDNIMNEFILNFGISDKFKEYLSLKVQALELFKEAYVDGETYKRVLAKVRDSEAEAIFKEGTKQNIYDISAYLTKNGFGRIDLKAITVMEFYSYLKQI